MKHPPMPLHSFADLLAAARAEPEPQCLLLVFTARELPPDAAPAHRERFARGEGGALVPVICVDKRPEEIVSFAALRAEAELTGKGWDILFIAALSGRGGRPPESDESVQSLRIMVQQIRDGRISNFLTVDRKGDLIELRAG